MMGKLLIHQRPLKALCTETLANAEIIEDSLVFADLNGVYSHGVIKLKSSLDRLNNKLIENKTELHIKPKAPLKRCSDCRQTRKFEFAYSLFSFTIKI